MRVQPGVVLAELNKQIASHGLHYGIDPSTQNRATIGGGVGNNSCGAHSVVYGKTIDQVIAPRSRAGGRIAGHAGAASTARRCEAKLTAAGPRRRALPRDAAHRRGAARPRSSGASPRSCAASPATTWTTSSHDDGAHGRRAHGRRLRRARWPSSPRRRCALAAAAEGQGPRRGALPHPGRSRGGDGRGPGASRRRRSS